MTPPEQSSGVLTSALTPAGPAAEMIADLWWLMLGVFGAVFVIVMALLFFGIQAKRTNEKSVPPLGDKKFIIIGGILVPAVILVAILIHTLISTDRLRVPDNAMTIRVTGYMWWWDVYYPEHGIRLANEIYIPVDTPVRVELDSFDVIHSLWVPSLSGKTDLLPGIPNTHWLQASKPGTYRGQCAEYCGTQHAWMGFYVVAKPREEFEQWVQARLSVKTVPTHPQLRRGYETFNQVGCASCHAIRGTQFKGSVGPDLTHMGSRLSIGAAKLPNNHGNLAGWISNPQAIKPGNKMPATTMESERLHALVAYLMSLK